jgi:hypothetical protein
MYIKVNKRFSPLRRCDKLQFSVIESYRENGKVKHRTLVYLTSIFEDVLKNSSWICHFWKACADKLEKFPEVERKRLFARLETFVPRPSEEMREGAKRRMDELTAEISQLMGYIPH